MAKILAETNIPVKGRKWRFILMTDRAFDKLHNSNEDESLNHNAAMTVPAKYEVHFPKSEWNIVDIRHELTHCYFYMSGTNSSELTPLQVEETLCEIMGKNGPELVMNADRVAECFFSYKK